MTPLVQVKKGVTRFVVHLEAFFLIGSVRAHNDRLREHDASLGASPSGNLAVHCGRCGGSPSLGQVCILGRGGERLEREMARAFFMIRVGGIV